MRILLKKINIFNCIPPIFGLVVMLTGCLHFDRDDCGNVVDLVIEDPSIGEYKSSVNLCMKGDHVDEDVEVNLIVTNKTEISLENLNIFPSCSCIKIAEQTSVINPNTSGAYVLKIATKDITTGFRKYVIFQFGDNIVWHLAIKYI